MNPDRAGASARDQGRVIDVTPAEAAADAARWQTERDRATAQHARAGVRSEAHDVASGVAAERAAARAQVEQLQQVRAAVRRDLARSLPAWTAPAVRRALGRAIEEAERGSDRQLHAALDELITATGTRSERYQSTRHHARDLRAALTDTDVDPPPARPATRAATATASATTARERHTPMSTDHTEPAGRAVEQAQGRTQDQTHAVYEASPAAYVAPTRGRDHSRVANEERQAVVHAWNAYESEAFEHAEQRDPDRPAPELPAILWPFARVDIHADAARPGPASEAAARQADASTRPAPHITAEQGRAHQDRSVQLDQAGEVHRHQHNAVVTSQAVHAAPREHRTAAPTEQTERGTDKDDHDRHDRDSRGVRGDVAIDSARTAVNVLAARRRGELDNRRTADTARAEQLNRWQHDDHHRHAASDDTGREATR